MASSKTNSKSKKKTYEELTADDLTMRLYKSDKGYSDYYGTLSIDTAEGAPLAIRINVIDGKNGLFVSFPSYKSGDEYVDLVYPTSADLRSKINGLAADVVAEF